MSNDAPPAPKPISFQKQMTKAYQNPLPCWKRIFGMAPIPTGNGRKPCHFIFIWMFLVPLAIKKTERMSILKALSSSRLCRRHPSVFAILSAIGLFPFKAPPVKHAAVTAAKNIYLRQTASLAGPKQNILSQRRRVSRIRLTRLL